MAVVSLELVRVAAPLLVLMVVMERHLHLVEFQQQVAVVVVTLTLLVVLVVLVAGLVLEELQVLVVVQPPTKVTLAEATVEIRRVLVVAVLVLRVAARTQQLVAEAAVFRRQ